MPSRAKKKTKSGKVFGVSSVEPTRLGAKGYYHCPGN